MTIAEVHQGDPTGPHTGSAGPIGAAGRAGGPAALRLAQRLIGPAGACLVAVSTLVVTLGVLAGWFDSLNVLHGVPLWVPVGVAVTCLLASAAGRTRRWWRTWGVGLAVTTTIVVGVAHWWIRSSGLVLDRYPTRFVVFTWIAVASVGIALTGWWAGPALLRTLRVLAAPASVTAAFLLINSFYGYWPTVATLLNKPVAGQVSKQALAQFLTPPPLPTDVMRSQLATARRGAAPITGSILATARPTTPPAGRTVPQGPDGHYGAVDIPSTVAGFTAAQAYLWLPPDFTAVPHAHVPVMVMLPGWPGNAQDWVLAGGVTDTANAWARTHGGQAPVMLFIDENGASGRDTECVDSIQGRAESYLVSSVPLFLEQTLGIAPDPRRWALVGYSEGGTCAITLALRHPGIYGRFVDIAGDPAPDYLDPASTLRVLFGGSTATEYRHYPGWLLQRNRYPGMDAWFATGQGDDLRAQNARLAALASKAGIDVRTSFTPGVHTWKYARRELNLIYPGLVTELSGAGRATTPAA